MTARGPYSVEDHRRGADCVIDTVGVQTADSWGHDVMCLETADHDCVQPEPRPLHRQQRVEVCAFDGCDVTSETTVMHIDTETWCPQHCPDKENE
jgi:hypothetical protein